MFESGPLGLAPNLGATTSLPSGIKLNSTGLWKLDIYIDNYYYESLFVEGKEANSRILREDQLRSLGLR
ncbi:hypothetical protein D3C81_1833970 [compost metagenome]